MLAGPLLKPKAEGGLGINPTRLVNQAFLIKLGWRLLSSPNSLWAQMLRSKYIQDKSYDIRLSRQSNLSPLSAGTVKNMDSIYANCMFTVAMDILLNFVLTTGWMGLEF